MQTITFTVKRPDKPGGAETFSVTFNGHITEAEYKPTPNYVPYLWELGPERRAERLAALWARLA